MNKLVLSLNILASHGQMNNSRLLAPDQLTFKNSVCPSYLNATVSAGPAAPGRGAGRRPEAARGIPGAAWDQWGGAALRRWLARGCQNGA